MSPGKPDAPLAHWAGALVALAVFLALALAALVGPLPGDVAARDTMLAWTRPSGLTALRALNTLGSWQALVPGALLLLAIFPIARRRWWVWLLLMAAAPAAEWLMKQLVARPRPESAAFGFPSGHATAATALFAAVFYLAATLKPPAGRTALRALAIAVIVLVAAARVVLRAHWPSDALGGVALGWALAALAARLGSPTGVRGAQDLSV